MSDQAPNEFEKAAHETGSGGGILREFWGFLRENKKWWLLPILILLLLFGLFIMLSTIAPGLAPFIYTLF